MMIDLGVIVLRVLVLGLICLRSYVVANTGPISMTNKGQVQGFRQRVLGKEVNVFLGIPYAKPPVGDLRFKHPVPNDGWSGIYNATKKPNACWQGLENVFPDESAAMAWSANTPRSEDCLYLNVWVPQVATHKKLPVMIWIFGGGFYSGSSALDVYDAKFIAAESDVIVVSMQYRLGALGFLALDHWTAPKNAGLFDQLMAIEWVEHNIHHFGGDYQSVTLFGESAGAVSVGMHMLSPKSRGKFHRVILQSGAPNAAWAMLSQKDAHDRSVKLAQLMDCDQETDEKIVECLRTKNASDFIEREWLTITYGVIRFPFVPVVDGVFLSEEPEKTLNKKDFKKCPVLLGHNTNEASYWLLYYDSAFPLKKAPEIEQEEFDLFIDKIFHYHPFYPKRLNSFGKEAIKFQYRNWINPDDKGANSRQIEMACGDFSFICPTVDFAQHYASTDNDVYYYVFEHRSVYQPWHEWMGVLHGDEIFYVFGDPLDETKTYSREDKKVSRKMMQYWTNFAKTGDPNKGPGDISMDEWPKYDNKTRKHLIIRGDLINNVDKSKSIGQGARVSQCSFWKEYLPNLVVKTANMSEMEVEWKIQFNDWSTKYIVEWKRQFDNFLLDQRRDLKCPTIP